MIEKDEAADEFGRTGNLNGISSPNQVKVEHLPLVKQKYDTFRIYRIELMSKHTMSVRKKNTYA